MEVYEEYFFEFAFLLQVFEITSNFLPHIKQLLSFIAAFLVCPWCFMFSVLSSVVVKSKYGGSLYCGLDFSWGN